MALPLLAIVAITQLMDMERNKMIPNCNHTNTVVEHRGSMQFIDGAVDDDLSDVLVCTDCGRDLVDMDKLFCKGCGAALPSCNCDLPID
jgi:hypothetical protein